MYIGTKWLRCYQQGWQSSPNVVISHWIRSPMVNVITKCRVSPPIPTPSEVPFQSLFRDSTDITLDYIAWVTLSATIMLPMSWQSSLAIQFKLNASELMSNFPILYSHSVMVTRLWKSVSAFSCNQTAQGSPLINKNTKCPRDIHCQPHRKRVFFRIPMNPKDS